MHILQHSLLLHFRRWLIHNYVENLRDFVLFLDHQVILGNHRDAWVFGAVDPNSGTAALMSLAKVIGQLRHDHGKFASAACSYHHETARVIRAHSLCDPQLELVWCNLLPPCSMASRQDSVAYSLHAAWCPGRTLSLCSLLPPCNMASRQDSVTM